jgi:hypothetical protein
MTLRTILAYVGDIYAARAAYEAILKPAIVPAPVEAEVA